MSLVLRGVMQSPVTPLKEDFSPDELEQFACDFEEAKHHHVSS